MTTSDAPANSNAAPLTPDTVIGGYRIIRQLANGGMGVVYEASHTILPRRAALKVMHRELLAADDSCQRLLQEACILERFQHPGVVEIYDCGNLPDGRPWIAMELVSGVTLASRISAGPRLPVDQVVRLMSRITEILVPAHALGIVHRDLKPDNILLEGAGVDRPRLIDWGIATQHLPGPRITLGNSTLGTPTYMAPEQARGLPVDGRCDIYALGILAYEVLTGDPPFLGATAVDVMMKHLTTLPRRIRQLRPDLSPFFAAVLEQMLAKEPEDRPTAPELLTALDYVASREASPRVGPAPVSQTAFDELGPIAGSTPANDVAVTSAGAPDHADGADDDRDDDDDDGDAGAYAELVVDDAPMLGAPRWTPQHLVATDRPGGRTPITPRTQTDAIAGEVDTDA